MQGPKAVPRNDREVQNSRQGPKPAKESPAIHHRDGEEGEHFSRRTASTGSGH